MMIPIKSPCFFHRVEKQMIHNVMGSSCLQSSGSVKYDLRAFSLNVVNVSDGDLSAAGTRIQVEAPQVHSCGHWDDKLLC